MKSKRSNTRLYLLMLTPIVLISCDRRGVEPDATDQHGSPQPKGSTGTPAITNRVDIPAAVRENLGITFATVEYRNVAKTLRVPGRFELTPTARREYRTPLGGTVEILVSQYQAVEPGTALYRVDSGGWRELREQTAATQAKVDSMGPLREAHRVHEKSLADKVMLWQERLKQLDELRTAGGGSAAQYTEARATLNATQADLADVMEKDAQLEAEEAQARAELRTLKARHDMLARAASCDPRGTPSIDRSLADAAYTVCAVSSGVVETIGMTPGGLAEESGLVLTVVKPEEIRFRARALQSDLGRLRDGLPVTITPPHGGSIGLDESMSGRLTIGLTADPDERTVELVTIPDQLAGWARAGVSAHLEITLAGGSDEYAIPLSAVVRDGITSIIFRRDPANPDKVIRMEADLGLSDGRWVVVKSGVKEGDQVVLAGNYQLMLASSGTAAKGGHFHSDGTFHEGED